MRLSEEPRTPTLQEVVYSAIETALSNVNVCLPAKIVRYDAATQYADVQPQLQKRYETGVLVKLPVIPNVPVKHPKAQGAWIHMPIKEGDDVLLVFSQRSLDNWKTQGGFTDPADRRKFNLTDAVALVGCSALPDAFHVEDPDAIEIVNDAGKLQVKKDGTINIGSYAPEKSVALGEAVEARLSALEQGLLQIVQDFSAFIVLYTAHVHLETLPPATPTSPPVAPGVPPTPFTPDTSVVSSDKAKVVP